MKKNYAILAQRNESSYYQDKVRLSVKRQRVLEL